MAVDGNLRRWVGDEEVAGQPRRERWLGVWWVEVAGRNQPDGGAADELTNS